MNRKLKLLSIGSLVLTLLSETAFACDCMLSPHPCEAYWQVEAVFIGTAKELSWIEFEEKLEDLVIKRKQPVFSFSVDQAFRGVNGSQVAVKTGMWEGDCGYGFKIGEHYLVYAYRDGQKKEMLATSICTRTRPISNADEDLEYIQGLSKASPGGWVFGEVFKSNRGPEGLLPLEGVKITVEGQGKSVTIMTNSDGKFRTSSLPEGSYKVRVSPPEGLSAGRNESENESEVKVADRGCVTVRFELAVDGRVSGRVLDTEGRPLSNCYVMLNPAEAEKRYSGFSDGASADGEGRYELRRIPPGQYKLSVYYNGPRGELLKSFPTFYYPGVLSADQAGVIVVGESAKVEDVDFRLPPPPERTVEGVVLWPDGKPAPNAQLICYLHGGRMRPPIKIDEQGHFLFKIYEGVDAFLVAEIEIEKGKWMRGELKAAERGDLVGVKLILTPQKDN
jgi:Carboxypeptidase regulatory-like domain